MKGQCRGTGTGTGGTGGGIDRPVTCPECGRKINTTKDGRLRSHRPVVK